MSDERSPLPSSVGDATVNTRLRNQVATGDPARLELIDPWSYAENGYPHELWARLRRESPVSRFELPGYRPFWAITKHADVCMISKRPAQFQNAGAGIVGFPGDWSLAAATFKTLGETRGVFRCPHQRSAQVINLIEMDPPEHRECRNIASPRLRPGMLRKLEREIADSARQFVDELARNRCDGECDFVSQVAARHPAHIIARILGLPREDESFIIRFANELFGHDDPEYRRGKDLRGHHQAIMAEFLGHISEIVADRRAHPRDDLASDIANARISNGVLADPEIIGYFLTLFTAGHETTRNAISGGLLALIEHPGELKRLRGDPTLMPRAADEMVRWTSPVNYMTRRATEDCEIRGQAIRRDDRLVLFYASANRDEEVFEDPFAFRIDRHPNPHLGFGIGEHFCLGAELAIKTSTALFAELIPRLEAIELAGQPERVVSSFVAGLKHLPIRCRIASAP